MTEQEKQDFLFESGWVHYVQTDKWKKNDQGQSYTLEKAIKLESEPRKAEITESTGETKEQSISSDELVVTIFSKPDSQGRQSFDIEWWSEDLQCKRGQSFFCVLDKQLALWQRIPRRTPRFIHFYQH